MSEPDGISASKHADKDLSFLLDTSIYHPVSNIDAPPPFRHPLPTLPATDTPLSEIFQQLSMFLGKCQFLSAAHLSATTLVSGMVAPSDTDIIFRLLSIRYSALELSGNVLLAAQEAKALEDLSSTFYYDETASTDGGHATPHHIMPFDLRLQALRLQGIGFGDSRRTVGALFDVGMECRENIMSAQNEEKEKALWRDRLDEIGTRVVNALIDLGDLDCARRTLESMQPDSDSDGTRWTTRLVLLLIKMGEIRTAKNILKAKTSNPGTERLLRSFLAVADGELHDAAQLLSEMPKDTADSAILAIAQQNLAVAYLYAGEIEKSRQILENLISTGHSFQALTVNLATLYDLSSDKSKDLKMAMAVKVAEADKLQPQRAFVNADFKL